MKSVPEKGTVFVLTFRRMMMNRRILLVDDDLAFNGLLAPLFARKATM